MAITAGPRQTVGALPPAQLARRARCAHPRGGFEPFPPAAVRRSVPERFEQIARRFPDRVAVKAGPLSVTYDELNRAANQIAHAVLVRRPDRAEPIALLMEKGAALIAGELAVLKAGKIFVPLDPTFPEARLAALLGECQAPLILTSPRYERLATRLAGGHLGVLNVEALDGGIPADDLRLPLDGSSLAYIMFTSGSTAEPKGVLHSHRGLLSQAMRHTNALHISAEDRVSVMGAMGASQAHTQIYVSLLNGAAALPWDLKQDGLADLDTWLAREGVTYHRSSASIFRRWAERLDRADAFPALRLVGVGSEPVYRADFELYRRRFAPHCLFLNALSSTETGTIAMNLLDGESPLDGRLVPVGYPVEDAEVLLLDEEGAEVGDGDVGAIAVRSAGLAVGYWRQEEMTREKFRSEPGAGDRRTYWVGDVGRRDADGALVHLGRGDRQVKIHGHRVELGEIEAALSEHEAVREAVVVDREDRHGEKRLVAYLVAKGEPPTRGALRSALRERLPHYMIPHAFAFLDALPVAPSGKIDRRALPPLAPPSRGGEVAPPPGMLGAQLSGIWEDLLGVGGVGLRDDFLELGGDSLLAIEMLARIEAVCGRTLAPSRLLDGAITIERLVRMLLDDQRPGWGEPIAAMQTGGSRPALFFLHGDFEHGGLYCHTLARALGPEQPFYSVTPHGLDGGPMPWSIEAMAADRLAAIRAVQPAGPYRLGGFCNGGVIAFEMARQLERQGESVDALLLIDSRAINAPPAYRLLAGAVRRLAQWRRWSEAARRDFFLRLRTFLEAYGDSARPGGRGRVRFLSGKVSAMWRPPAETAAAPADTAADEVSALAVLRPAYGERLRDYVPGAYRGRIALFRSSHLRERPPSGPTAGWRRVGAAVDVHPLPGNHQLAVTRHVAVLAEKMRPYLGPRPA